MEMDGNDCNHPLLSKCQVIEGCASERRRIVKPSFIDETAETPVAEPNDWYVLEPKTFVQHKATSLMFEIYPNSDKSGDDTLGFSDFFARRPSLRGSADACRRRG
jgi:hypothetical protein